MRKVYNGYFFLLLISCDRVAAYKLARNPAFGQHMNIPTFREVRYEKENNEGWLTIRNNKLCG